jgi:hypothetical protein
VLRRIDQQFAAGEDGSGGGVSPTDVAIDRINPNRVRDLFQAFVEIEGDAGAADAGLPHVHAAARGISSQPITLFHQQDLDAEPGGREGSAESAGARANDNQVIVIHGRARWQLDPQRSRPARAW